MKKIICMLSLFAVCVGFLPYSNYNQINIKAAENEVKEKVPNYKVEEITEKEEIKKYLESNGQEYDPNVVGVCRIIDLNMLEENTPETQLGNDYYIKNKKVSTGTDTNTILAQFGRPAGTVTIREKRTISHTFSASGKISASILTAELGYKVNGSASFNIDWTRKFSYPVTITIHPVYRTTKGELWEDDVFFDDKLGTFTAKRAIGDDILYKRK